MQFQVELSTVLQGVFLILLTIVSYFVKGFVDDMKVIMREWGPMKAEIDLVMKDILRYRDDMAKVTILERDLKTAFTRIDELRGKIEERN